MLYNIKIVSNLPDIIREFPGVSDAQALRLEVETLRGELDTTIQQMETERALTGDIRRARAIAIASSPALGLVFKRPQQETTTMQEPEMTDLLTHAFFRTVDDSPLPPGLSKTIAKEARTAAHPDAGGDVAVAQTVGELFLRPDVDEVFSVGQALLLSAKNPLVQDATALRNERYRLAITTRAATPVFESETEAQEVAEREINGAEWRVRTFAAFKTIELLIGNDEIWYRFLEDVAQQQNMHIIRQVNRCMPALQSLQERLLKGDPLDTSKMGLEAIDAIFERIWTTLGNKDKDAADGVPYSPPYNNWLEILLPALEMLDPGEKPGEEYTYFEPPFQARPTYYPPQSRDYDDRFGSNGIKNPFLTNDYEEKPYKY